MTNQSRFAPLYALALAAAMASPQLQASRLEKTEATPFRDGHHRICAGCRIRFEAVRTTVLRLDRAPRASAFPVPVNVCSDPGASLWFPEETEHLAAFLNSQAPELK